MADQSDNDLSGSEKELIRKTRPAPRPTLEEVLRDAWNDLLEKDDRTSPEDTPEMALITFEELCEFMCRAHGVGR